MQGKVVLVLLACLFLACFSPQGGISSGDSGTGDNCELSASWSAACETFVAFRDGECGGWQRSDAVYQERLLACQSHAQDVYYQCSFDGYNQTVSFDMCSETPNQNDMCVKIGTWINENCSGLWEK